MFNIFNVNSVAESKRQSPSIIKRLYVIITLILKYFNHNSEILSADRGVSYFASHYSLISDFK